MKAANASRSRGQVYSVGNYLMTGKVLGKGHFARVEEATHRIIGKKVAIKVIDLTCIKEEYARRHLHREPRVMARLRHPCIAALYETMMHGPRLYVVMEAASGGDLCAHVLAARGPGAAARGLPEARARALAAQLVSAVRHMHTRGVVHRDLKMENIMLDSTKQFIKIVDFGLSNVWSAGGALRTPCGSLEYAAPELFVDGRRYGPEVDLWSIGVIVYGMVTGGLPFAGGAEGAGGEGRSRPQLRAAIARGFARKQRAALASVSSECKTFIQQLLETNVELRMKIEEAARHRWIKRTGMRMKTHPLGGIEPKLNREMYRQISELCGQTVMDVVAQIKADPFGATAGIYNIKTHLHQMHALPGIELLWSTNTQEPRPATPPEYRNPLDAARPDTAPSSSKATSPPPPPSGAQHQKMFFNSTSQRLRIQNGVASAKPHQVDGLKIQNGVTSAKPYQVDGLRTQNGLTSAKPYQVDGLRTQNGVTSAKPYQVDGLRTQNGVTSAKPYQVDGLRTQNGVTSTKPYQVDGATQVTGLRLNTPSRQNAASQVTKELLSTPQRSMPTHIKAQQAQQSDLKQLRTEVVRSRSQPLESPRFTNRPLSNVYGGLKKPIYKIYDSGDCGLDPRLPSIDEHSNTDLGDARRNARVKARTPGLRKVNLEDERRLNSCPNRIGDGKRTEFYRRAGDGLPSWRSSGIMATPSARILLQSNATTIKRASLGNIVSPHSSSNSQCKSERAMPAGWYSTRNQLTKESTHLQRFRRTAPMK